MTEQRPEFPLRTPMIVGILALLTLVGGFGGWAWAMIPGILRTRFNTNEILVSLLLVYI